MNRNVLPPTRSSRLLGALLCVLFSTLSSCESDDYQNGFEEYLVWVSGEKLKLQTRLEYPDEMCREVVKGRRRLAAAKSHQQLQPGRIVLRESGAELARVDGPSTKERPEWERPSGQWELRGRGSMQLLSESMAQLWSQAPALLVRQVTWDTNGYRVVLEAPPTRSPPPEVPPPLPPMPVWPWNQEDRDWLLAETREVEQLRAAAASKSCDLNRYDAISRTLRTLRDYETEDFTGSSFRRAAPLVWALIDHPSRFPSGSLSFVGTHGRPSISLTGPVDDKEDVTAKLNHMFGPYYRFERTRSNGGKIEGVLFPAEMDFDGESASPQATGSTPQGKMVGEYLRSWSAIERGQSGRSLESPQEREARSALWGLLEVIKKHHDAVRRDPATPGPFLGLSSEEPIIREALDLSRIALQKRSVALWELSGLLVAGDPEEKLLDPAYTKSAEKEAQNRIGEER